MSAPEAPRPSIRRELLTRLRGESPAAALVRGTSTAFMIGVSATGIGLVFNIVLARALGADSFGIFVFVGGWLGLVQLLVTVGMPDALVRFVAEYRAAREWGLLAGLLRRTMQIALAASFVTMLLSVPVLLLLSGRMSRELMLTFIAGIAFLPLTSIRQVQGGALNGFRKIFWSHAAAVVRPVVMLPTVLVIALLAPNVLRAYHISLMTSALSGALFVFSYFVLRRATSVARDAAPEYRTRQWLRVGVPLIVAQQVRSLMDRTDLILVGILLGTQQAGIYHVAQRIASFGNFGLIATNAITTPLVAELYREGDRERLQRTVTLSAWGTLVIGVAIAVFIIITHRLVLHLFGAEFESASTPTLILLAASFGNTLTGPIGPMLTMTGHQDDNLKVVAGTALLNLVLNYPAIELWGMSGAAAATATSMTVSNVWSWYFVWKRTGINPSVFARQRISL